jgi:hypothetical protein
LLERLDERVLLSAVMMQALTEVDARTLAITYEVDPSPPASVEVDFYRSPSNIFDAAQAVKIGSTTLTGAQLTPGAHAPTPVALPNNPDPNGPDPLSPDPLN